jgi:predicted dehydrogenase
MDISRREFVQSAAAAGASMLVADRVLAQAAAAAEAPALNVALIGAGTQGRVLTTDCLSIPGIRFRAVCDIWAYSQRYATRSLKSQYKKAGHPDWAETVNTYEDYKVMLETEKELDAVIVATPDFWHAEHTIACLKAGRHVYCEKEMSNSLQTSAAMVKGAADSGKLLQIGHQRRSNPIYRMALKMIRDDKVCGRPTVCYGQWNRGVQPKLEWPPDYEIPAATLKAFGYDSMEHFRNWRWYRKYSAGPIADLGSHQIDIFSWFLEADPRRVVALGDTDYFKDREWYSDVLCTYDYKTASGSARAFYQVLNTNSYGSYFERFGGDGGSLTISEDPRKCYYVAEPGKEMPAYMAGVEKVMHDGLETVPLLPAITAMGPEGKAAVETFQAKNVHQLHLENFFEAVRRNDKKLLNCPAEEAYKTAVAVLNVIPAIEAAGGVAFKPEDFKS